MTAVDMLSTIWKSHVSEKIEREFLHAGVVLVLLNGLTTSILTKRRKYKNTPYCFEQILEAALLKRAAARPPATHKKYLWDEQDMVLIYPTPLLGQDMTQGQFLSRV